LELLSQSEKVPLIKNSPDLHERKGLERVVR
jgi:hypothetical protein